MDGTNNKSQMILIEGNCISFEASASAGENCTPGVSVKYADGKTAIINAKDTSALNSSSKAVEKFFNSEVNIGIDGVTKK